MVGVVKRVQKVLVEGVNLVDPGEGLENVANLLGECLLSVLDFTSVEGSNTRNLEACADLGRKSTLCPRQDDVEELRAIGDRRNLC